MTWPKSDDPQCADCKIPMVKKGWIDLHDTDCSCCGTNYVLWQCPKCKTVALA